MIRRRILTFLSLVIVWGEALARREPSPLSQVIAADVPRRRAASARRTFTHVRSVGGVSRLHHVENRGVRRRKPDGDVAHSQVSPRACSGSLRPRRPRATLFRRRPDARRAASLSRDAYATTRAFLPSLGGEPIGQATTSCATSAQPCATSFRNRADAENVPPSRDWTGQRTSTALPQRRNTRVVSRRSSHMLLWPHSSIALAW
jgi:hypothetical protein